MDTDGNRVNVAEVTEIEADPAAGAPDTGSMWRAGLKRALFAAAVAAVAVFVSSVVSGACWVWYSISNVKADHAERVAETKRIADLRRKIEEGHALSPAEFRDLRAAHARGQVQLRDL